MLLLVVGGNQPSGRMLLFSIYFPWSNSRMNPVYSCVSGTHLLHSKTTFSVCSPERLLRFRESVHSAVSFPSSFGIVPVWRTTVPYVLRSGKFKVNDPASTPPIHPFSLFFISCSSFSRCISCTGPNLNDLGALRKLETCVLRHNKLTGE